MMVGPASPLRGAAAVLSLGARCILVRAQIPMHFILVRLYGREFAATSRATISIPHAKPALVLRRFNAAVNNATHANFLSRVPSPWNRAERLRQRAPLSEDMFTLRLAVFLLVEVSRNRVPI